MLDATPSRVRELAREALTELSPATASRVDPEWRGQLADYILGQQSGPESTATKSHLKRSEAARAWTYSLLDSLDHLYGNGVRPAVPGAEDGAAPAPRRERERKRERDRDRARPVATAAAAEEPGRAAPRQPGGAGCGGEKPCPGAAAQAGGGAAVRRGARGGPPAPDRGRRDRRPGD